MAAYLRQKTLKWINYFLKISLAISNKNLGAVHILLAVDMDRVAVRVTGSTTYCGIQKGSSFIPSIMCLSEIQFCSIKVGEPPSLLWGHDVYYIISISSTAECVSILSSAVTYFVHTQTTNRLYIYGDEYISTRVLSAGDCLQLQ